MFNSVVNLVFVFGVNNSLANLGYDSLVNLPIFFFFFCIVVLFLILMLIWVIDGLVNFFLRSCTLFFVFMFDSDVKFFFFFE